MTVPGSLVVQGFVLLLTASLLAIVGAASVIASAWIEALL